MSKIMVTGSGAGLGLAIAKALRADGHEVLDFDRKRGHDVRDPCNTYQHTIRELDGLINCAGVNIAGWLEDVTTRDFEEVMGINARGIFEMSKWTLPALIKSKGFILNIVSNASHVPMTSSLAYNASKGAAHIMTLQLARELTKKYGITVFGLSPNKLRDTEMSHDIEAQTQRIRGWTADEAKAYQLAALLPGEETPPESVAEFIAFLLWSKPRHKYLAGCIIPYGA